MSRLRRFLRALRRALEELGAARVERSTERPTLDRSQEWDFVVSTVEGWPDSPILPTHSPPPGPQTTEGRDEEPERLPELSSRPKEVAEMESTAKPQALVKILDGALATQEAVAFISRVREVASTVMQQGIHYGKIPGTEKRSLWQPGAETLCATFRLSPTYVVDDRSVLQPAGGDPRLAVYRYAVTCRLVHAPTGLLVAEGLGEASTEELKYRWRLPTTRAEYDATPEEFRGQKYARWGQYGPKRWLVKAELAVDVVDEVSYTLLQVRTTPADLANTVRKMAAKRAMVGATRSATAASDTFSEDLEDLTAAGVDPQAAENGRPPVEEPRSTPPPRQSDPPRQSAQSTPPPANGGSQPPANGRNGGNGKATFDEAKAERVGANIPPEAWDRAREGFHDKRTISEAQVRMILAVGSQTHAECHEKKCPSCQRAGQALPVRRAWQFSDVRNLVGANLGLALEEIPWGDTKEAIVAIFETYEPAA